MTFAGKVRADITPLELSEELSAEIKKTLKDLCGIDLANSLLFACSYCDCVTDSGKRVVWTDRETVPP